MEKRQNNPEEPLTSSKRQRKDSDEEMRDEVSEFSESDEEIIEEGDEDDEMGEDGKKKRIYRPGIDQLEEDEELEVDMEAYEMFHQLGTPWPCLSFDVIKDSFGANRNKYPYECLLVGGSQAETKEKNALYVMKWSNLTKNQEQDSEDESESESEEDQAPVVSCISIKHFDMINKVKMMPQTPICAAWSEDGSITIYNLQKQVKELEAHKAQKNDEDEWVGLYKEETVAPIFKYNGHGDEGFAMSWNPVKTGQMVSGDRKGVIKLWTPVQGGWSINTEFTGHAKNGASCEDVQWKKTGAGTGFVFASCGSDGTVMIWDTRQKNKEVPLLTLEHTEPGSGIDVNVIDWNPLVGDLLASGADDGSFKVFRLDNMFKDNEVVENVVCEKPSGDITSDKVMAEFEYHRDQITSINWHPTDESALCVASGDQTVSLWDMAVENDAEEEVEPLEGAEDFPPQLLFLHQGQTDVKTALWHPQIPGVVLSTASDGFNVFRPHERCQF